MTRQHLILVLIAIVLSPWAMADECKYTENESDPFTKTRVVLTKWKPFRPTGNQAVNHGWMAGRVQGGKTFLALRIGVVGYDGPPIIIPEGGKLLVLMADESVVELAAHEETWVEDGSTAILYELNDVSLTALTTQGATDIRISTTNGDHDFNFGNKPTDRMQFVLTCARDA